MSDKLPPSFLRVQDRLLDYLRKYLVGARISRFILDPEAISLSFRFKNEHSDNLFLFGYKDRQLFFGKQSKDEIYLSWSGETKHQGDLEDYVTSYGADRTNSQVDDFTLENYLDKESKKIKGAPFQKKKIKFLQRKLKNISDDILLVKFWKQMQIDLAEDKIDLSTNEVVVYDHVFKFSKNESIWEKKDIIYKKIKRLKKAEEILNYRLGETILELSKVQVGDFEFEVTKEKIIQPLWMNKSLKAKNIDSNILIKNFMIRNISGVISLDATSNDWIRAQASKQHYWFHIDKFPGAHCILKTDDFAQLRQVDIEALASMLRDFSKLEITDIPVVYTQVKNLKGIKGSKGEVIIKKQKHLRCVYNNWKEIISIH